MSTPEPSQSTPEETEVVGGTPASQQTAASDAPTEVVSSSGPTVGGEAAPSEGGEAAPSEGQTQLFGPPDSYGVPESADLGASTQTQPFPTSEPEADAPLGDFELAPADTYEPDVDVQDSPPAAETAAAPAPTPPPPPPPAAQAPAPAPADLPPVPVPPQTPGYAAPTVLPPAATAASGAYAQAQQPAPASQAQQYPPAQQPYGQQPYGQQPYAQQPYAQQAYGYGSAADPYAKSRVVAGVLGILLGGLGIHRFYLGYVGIGIAQIAVTIVTFGVGAIWGFIEGILYLTQKTGSYSVDATGRPLRD